MIRAPGLRAVLARLLFYPTLGWNLLLARVLAGRRWYDRIDDAVWLGALPFPSHAAELRALGVRGVVNTCAEYTGPVAAYRREGLVQLHIPTVDFTPPSLADVHRALAFIRDHAARGEAVYVHCKAGRGRSATVALCWLIAERGMSPEAALGLLIAKRPHVNRTLAGREVVRAIHREAAVGAARAVE